MLLSVRATVADALALTLASAGPFRTPQGSHEQPDEVEPADCCTDQAHRNLKRAEQSLRQKIGPTQQQWTARCFSDTACLGFQAAFVKFRSSRSTSFGVRYPRAE